jgi:hypothetical protein
VNGAAALVHRVRALGAGLVGRHGAEARDVGARRAGGEGAGLGQSGVGPRCGVGSSPGSAWTGAAVARQMDRLSRRGAGRLELLRRSGIGHAGPRWARWYGRA